MPALAKRRASHEPGRGSEDRRGAGDRDGPRETRGGPPAVREKHHRGLERRPAARARRIPRRTNVADEVDETDEPGDGNRRQKSVGRARRPWRQSERHERRAEHPGSHDGGNHESAGARERQEDDGGGGPRQRAPAQRSCLTSDHRQQHQRERRGAHELDLPPPEHVAPVPEVEEREREEEIRQRGATAQPPRRDDHESGERAVEGDVEDHADAEVAAAGA